jgi:hypothetical protein
MANNNQYPSYDERHPREDWVYNQSYPQGQDPALIDQDHAVKEPRFSERPSQMTPDSHPTHFGQTPRRSSTHPQNRSHGRRDEIDARDLPSPWRYQSNHQASEFFYQPQQRFSDQQTHRGKGPKNFQRSDERILEDVCEYLEEDGRIDASEIEVNIKKGVITLTGPIESRRMKKFIENQVDQCRGVRDVRNNLEILGLQDKTAKANRELLPGTGKPKTSSKKKKQTKH